LGDRRGHDVQPCGGSGEVQLFGHGDKEEQVPDVHRRSSGRCITDHSILSNDLVDIAPRSPLSSVLFLIVTRVRDQEGG